jgi:hypothetical protein
MTRALLLRLACSETKGWTNFGLNLVLTAKPFDSRSHSERNEREFQIPLFRFATVTTRRSYHHVHVSSMKIATESIGNNRSVRKHYFLSRMLNYQCFLFSLFYPVRSR